MQLKRILSIVMVLTLLVAFPVIAQDEEVTTDQVTTDASIEGEEVLEEEQQPEIAAVVNGEQITRQTIEQFSNIQNLIMSLYQQYQEFTMVLLRTEAGNNVIDEYQKLKLDQLINQILLAQEAVKKGITLSDEEIDQVINNQISSMKEQYDIDDAQFEQTIKDQGFESVEAYKAEFYNNYKDSLVFTIPLANKMSNQIIQEIEITDQEIEQYYKENKANYELPEQVKTSHILLEDRETAEEVMEKLKNGGDFTELAKEYSTASSAEKGGDIGYISKDQNLAKEFKDAVFALEAGKTSPIVETKYGFHIIKVFDKKEAGIRALKEVRNQIEDQLKYEKGQSEVDKFVKKLREEAEIEKKL
ncbi:MAG: peptidylprolyl isomerase [Halanaerobiales bacterium]|nr:peptidylprolyl isomerase [Halanaerobiales bacterium]